jgi:outer membrane protein OmpA-like peptidoglycan-associated protein
MYYDDYDDEDHSRRWKIMAGVVAVLAVGAVLIWQVRSGSSNDDVAGRQPAATDASGSVPEIDGSPSGSERPPTTDESSGSTPSTSARPGAQTSGAQPATTEGSGTTNTTAATASTVGSTAAATGASDLTSTDSTVSTVPTNPALGYPTNPDGTPLPVVVIFDTDTITISGQVPSQAAKDRLGTLAVANSQFPDAGVVDNMVVNPAVPISVGVRVIELNSARFPEGSAEILPAHALELDRVVNIMKALPNISVLVIGHADQRGDEAANFAISDERARAVLNYLLYLGISPTRLASRAAGETDLLTLAEDDTALELNRRTEFVFFGLLVE